MKISIAKFFTLGGFFKVLIYSIILASLSYFFSDIQRGVERYLHGLFNHEFAHVMNEFEKNESVFDEAVHNFICSDSYIKNGQEDKNTPEEIRFSNYKKIRSNPYYRKWVADNYKVSQQDISHFVDEIKMLPLINAVSIEEQKEKSKRLFNNFLDAFFNKKKIYKIPHIHHRMWITSNDNPIEVPDRTFNLYLKTLKTFPKDWKHIFWCLDPTKIPKTIKTLENCGTPVEIRSLKEMVQTMPGKYLFNKLYEEKHYAAVADIAKRYVVYKLGGLYSDIGVFWKKDPTELVDTFDRIFSLEELNPDLSVFAYSKESLIEETFFNILEEFPSLPIEIRKKFIGNNITKITWSLTLKVLLNIKSNMNEKIFYWDHYEKFFRDWKHYGTWKNTKGIFGNKPITQSTTEW